MTEAMTVTAASDSEFEYCILGAGPGGLQLGYYLQKQQKRYVILEVGEAPGRFFTQYPRHRKLISINKVHTGVTHSDTNLRWDWNSLLCDDDRLRFKNYSQDYFPHADQLVHYLRDFANEFQLNIRFNTKIVRVSRKDGFVLADAAGRQFLADKLIVATGKGKPYTPNIPGIELAEAYADMPLDPKEFTDQRVVVIGKGNSALETADNLIQSTAVIHLLSPNPVRLAWATHYVGDLRAVNNNFLDTYQLKSQNTIVDATIERIEKLESGQLRLSFLFSHAHGGQRGSIVVDRALLCTGFMFDDSIFDRETCPLEKSSCGKFPRMTSSWESTTVPHLYFAGTLMHVRDYRKSFSGFIHGFRYNIEFLSRMLANKYDGAPFAATTSPLTPRGLAQLVVERVNIASSLFQQPGFLADVMVPSRESDQIVHWRDMPVDFVIDTELPTAARFFTLTMEYGKLDKVTDPFNIFRFPTDGSTSAFIHPVIRYRDVGGSVISEHHMPEDLENEWDNPIYIEPLTGYFSRVVESLNGAGPHMATGGPRR